MSTVKSKKLQVGTDATATNNFTIYQPASPDGTLRIGVGNADSPTEVGRFDSNGYVATNAPTFSAYVGSAQTINTSVFTKMQCNTEEFDTASCYDPSTNYRFTPNVAGYYQVNGNVSYTAQVTAPQLAIYKNGSQAKIGNNPATGNWSCVSALIYLNGTTDYIELYCAHVTGTTQTLLAASQYNYFQASLARAA